METAGIPAYSLPDRGIRALRGLIAYGRVSKKKLGYFLWVDGDDVDSQSFLQAEHQIHALDSLTGSAFH